MCLFICSFIIFYISAILSCVYIYIHSQIHTHTPPPTHTPPTLLYPRYRTWLAPSSNTPPSQGRITLGLFLRALQQHAAYRGQKWLFLVLLSLAPGTRQCERVLCRPLCHSQLPSGCQTERVCAAASLS